MAAEKVKIKNYTSTVSVPASLSKIEEYLVEAGASSVQKEYDAGRNCSGIVFTFIVDMMPIQFKITAQIESCYKVLLDAYKRINDDTKATCREQAGRTAWKIISDWVEIQVPMQLFLPFAYNSGTGQTLYEYARETKYKLLNQ